MRGFLHVYLPSPVVCRVVKGLDASEEWSPEKQDDLVERRNV
jgi:hypothetical protein